MSHQPERKEKNCLNCGVDVLGPYCQNCGQKNVVLHQTFWQLITHFVYDIFHFDGKFFDTLKRLLFRPGYVPKQYVQGKRVSYLDPIRMYLFTSAIFFLVFFSLKDADKGFINFDETDNFLTAAERTEAIEDLKKELAEQPGDSALLVVLQRLQDTTKPIRSSDAEIKDSSILIGGFKNPAIKTAHNYDSVQKTLPRAQRHGWLKRLFVKRSLALNAKYNTRPEQGFEDFAELFIHKLPYLLFISLPFFALLLKLLYIRRKTYYYSDHAVFTLYHYIFSFILLLCIFLFSALTRWTELKLFQNLIPLLVLIWPVYLYKAMRNFYGQGRLKTFSKFLLLNLLGIIVLLLLFVLFLFFTLFQL